MTNGCIIITGTSRGCGRDLCIYYLKNNYTVIGVSRSKSGIVNSNFFEVNGDLNSNITINSIYERAKKINSNKITLINSAASIKAKNLFLTSDNDIDEVFTTNLISPIKLIKKLSGLMIKNKWGRIINISTVATISKPMGDCIYASSKKAFELATEILAKELYIFGITCNIIGINSYDSLTFKELNNIDLSRFLNSLPVKSNTTEANIINVINFYISDQSNTITGQKIFFGGIST